MLSITKLLGALNTLAENVLALSQIVNEVNVSLRGRLQLDAPDQPAVLDHEPAEGNSTGRRKRATA